MMENVTWRCATVRTSPKATTEGDDACFVASDCGGDADWRLHLKLSEEGADWQRIIEWPAPFQANPKGLAGSGSLVPPFAWVRKTIPRELIACGATPTTGGRTQPVPQQGRRLRSLG